MQRSLLAFPALALSVLTLRPLFQHTARAGTADQQVSLSAFAYLYSELVQYHANRVDNATVLERRLEASGFQVGLKMLELITYRNREVSVGREYFVHPFHDTHTLTGTAEHFFISPVQTPDPNIEYFGLCHVARVEISVWKEC